MLPKNGNGSKKWGENGKKGRFFRKKDFFGILKMLEKKNGDLTQKSPTTTTRRIVDL